MTAATDLHFVPVGNLSNTYLDAREVNLENLIDHLNVSADPDGQVAVTAIEQVRWSEFEAGPWPQVTSAQAQAAYRVLREVYNASHVTYTDEDDEGYLTVEWTVVVGPDSSLGDALVQLLSQPPERPQGVVGFHNAMNGGFGARNAYRDVREAVAAAADN